MGPEAEKYMTSGRELLEKAREALRQDDLVQASEKGWGAAAQAVKAVAHSRGWRHDGHAYLFQAVNRLVEETGDSRLATLLHTANSLHSNFYENWMPKTMVEIGVEQVQEFLNQLEDLLKEER